MKTYQFPHNFSATLSPFYHTCTPASKHLSYREEQPPLPTLI